MNAINQLNAEKVDFGDRYSGQQKVEVLLKGTIAPRHQPAKWVDRVGPQAELMRRLEAQACLLEVVGQGGFGKSSLAAWLYAQKQGAFAKALWVDASRVESFNQFSRWVLQEIGYLVDQRSEDEALAHELARQLVQHRCLLVVDQVERLPEGPIAAFEAFLSYWQTQGRSSFVLVTTRRRVVTDDELRLDLSGLAASEGKAFLAQSALTEGVENGLEQLVEIAEGHPYLLKMAVSWLRQKSQGEINAAGLAFFGRLFRHYQGDLEAKVEEIFAALFAALPERLQSLLLGVVVYRDAFGLEGAQAMVTDATIEDLHALTDRAFLLEQSERWTLHPLMKSSVQETLVSLNRHQESHEKAIAYFASKIKPSKDSIADYAEELEIIHHCCELGECALAHQIMVTCIDFLERRGYYRDLLPIFEQLTHTWTRENPDDLEGQRNLGWAWTRLGSLYKSVGRYQAAIMTHEKAQTIFNKIGDLDGKGGTLCNLAHVHHATGQVQLSIEYYQKALDAQREVGNRDSEASSLNGLGNAYHSLGQHQRAISFHQQSLEIRREIGDRDGEAGCLNGLGVAYNALGQYQRALNFHQQSLEIRREIGDRNGEANALMNLGNTHDVLGQYQRALNFHQQSLEIAREIGNRRCEAGSLGNLSCVCISLGQYKQAINYCEQSLEIASSIGDLACKANSLINLGFAHFALGQYQRAINFYQQSLEIQHEIGDRDGEADILNLLGRVYHSLERHERAINFYQQSLEITRDIGSCFGEAASLGNLGLSYHSLGQYQRAINFYQQSLEIMREIGSRKGEATFLMDLGNTYRVLGQYQRAIDFHQQSLEIQREIGDRNGEANSLFNKALALAKYEPRRFEAFATLQQAREIYVELQLEHEVEQCDERMYAFNQIIATEERQSAPILQPTPTIGNAPPKDDWLQKSLPTKTHPRPASQRQINWVLWFCVGVAIVLLIAWLRK